MDQPYMIIIKKKTFQINKTHAKKQKKQKKQ